MNQNKQKIYFIRLMQRVNIFLFVYLFLLLFFYIIGNFQSFLDSSQMIILRLMSYISILLFFLSFFAIIFSIFFALYQKTFVYFGRLVFNIVSCAAGVFFLFFSAGINFLAIGQI